MVNITGYKGINSSNYSITNDAKKVAGKNDVSTDNEKNQDITQNLGTDTFVKSPEEDTANSTYKPETKKLTTKEVSALKEDQKNVEADLIKKFVNDMIYKQNTLLGKSTENGTSELSKESTDLLTKIFGSVENAYPPLATTPEAAKAAISDGGPYSVDSVSDSIMTMATALSGDDTTKLQKMRDAVEKGFSKAASIFKKATNSDLPQICKDTYTEVMSRFDKLQNETSTSDEKS